MRMTIGNLYLGTEAILNNTNDIILLAQNDQIIGRMDFSFDITLGVLEPFSEYLTDVTELIIGHGHLPNLDFLKYLPNLERVDIMTSLLADISGLQYALKIRELFLQRPAYSLNVLGMLPTLTSIYLGDWRADAKSIFNLKNLAKISIKNLKREDLYDLSHWKSLREAWFNGGLLHSLAGIPQNIIQLRLTKLGNLSDLQPLSDCTQLEDLRIESCKGIHSLKGIEKCLNLRILSIGKGEVLESLWPLQNLQKVEYLLLGDGTQVNVEDGSTKALYNLPNLKRVIITKKAGVVVDKILKVSPKCQVILTK